VADADRPGRQVDAVDVHGRGRDPQNGEVGRSAREDAALEALLDAREGQLVLHDLRQVVGRAHGVEHNRIRA
jgi:hypothetical protein